MEDGNRPRPGSEFLSRTRNYLGSIKKDLKDLQGARALVGELTQNADDAPGAKTIRFEVTPEAFVVSNDGEFDKCDDVTSAVCAWLSDRDRRCDFHSFREVASGDKETREHTTGAFGIGFTSVYQITDCPELFSNGEHWILNDAADEAERIKRTPNVATAGTRFVLPWAREQSRMRQGIAQPLVTDERIVELTTELLDVAPELLLFLKRLKSLQVVADGRRTTFQRQVENDVVQITDNDGNSRRWLLLAADMGEAAQGLRNSYPDLIHPKRPTEVQAAIELDVEPAPGSYFVTLPTEQSTELPLNVNGSFFPKPDRKRIRLDDDPEGQWNQSIIDCGAQLLARSLERMALEIGNRWIVRLIQAAHDLAERVNVANAEDANEIWWERVSEALATQRIVPSEAGGHGTVSEVLLSNDDAEELPAIDVLAKLGILLVAKDLRSEWFQLNNSAGVGMRPLRLSSVVTALRSKQLPHDKPWVSEKLSADDRTALWALCDSLTRLRSSVESRHEATSLSFVPLQDGSIVAPRDAIAAMPGERAILVDGEFEAPLLDEDFGTRYRELAALATPLTASKLAELAGDGFASASVPDAFDRARLLDWFGRRSEDSLELGRDCFDGLPIFPTGNGFQTAVDLVVPIEGFTVPLRLGNWYDSRGRPAVVREFLIELGIPSLDLKHFCTDLVPKAVGKGLGSSELDQLLSFLARNLSQVKEDEGVHRVLRDLELVPCIDGAARRGDEVYSESVNPLVVGVQPIAARAASQLVGELFTWLGVSAEPRPADVVKHCLGFRSPPANHIEAVSAVLRHLQSVESEELDAEYSTLQTEQWLPMLHETRPARPAAIFTVFQDYLFASQAKFLGVPRKVQGDTADALEWLGVRSAPPTELVVDHLLHSAAKGEAVNREVLVFLNRHAAEPPLDHLRDRPSIPTEGRGYERPSHCFWESNPFGRHRVLLSPEFRQFQQLFDRIGVRSAPDADDVVEVLAEIGSAHGGAHQRLLEQDIPIVESCWVFLDELVRRGEVTERHVAELRNSECVLDADDWLRRPSEVLYRDSSQIAKKLSPELSARLIARPDNMKDALDAVGVRHLRQALRTEIVDREDRPGSSTFVELVTDRRQALARVLDIYDDAPFLLLDVFAATVDVLPLTRLVVIERLDLDGAPDHPSPSERAALWDNGRRELLVVEDHTRWPEIAREFVLALGIEGEAVTQAATSLMNVLRAQTSGDAATELDLLGYYEIEEAVDPDVESPESELPPDAPRNEEDIEPEDEQSAAQQSELEERSEQPDESTGDTEEARVGGKPDSPESGATPDTQGRTGSPCKPAEGQESTDDSSGGSGQEPAQPRSGGRSGTVTTGRKPSNSSPPKPRKRLISYVTPGDNAAADDAGVGANDTRSPIDEAAIEAVLEFEKSMGRSPHEMEHSNPGFDIQSIEPDGSIRYIEVKGTASAWDDLGVGITSRQYQEARDKEQQYWLYVVVVTSDGASEPFRIQDPASQIDRYYFDAGWRSVAEQSVAHFKELPPMATYPDPALLDSPVRLLDYLDGSDTATWIPCPEECVDLVKDGLFAVRIAGETLDLLHRGGVAFAIPDPDVADNDPVVVRLHDLIDPDTGGVLSIRYFGEERSATGELVSARLETKTAVAQISVDDLDSIEILGRVVHLQLPE